MSISRDLIPFQGAPAIPRLRTVNPAREAREGKPFPVVLTKSPMPGVLSILNCGPMEHTRICLLGDIHHDDSMLPKRERAIEYLNSKIALECSHIVYLLEGCSSLESARGSLSHQQFLGEANLGPSDRVHVLGCDNEEVFSQTEDPLRRWLTLVDDLAACSMEVETLENNLRFLKNLRDDPDLPEEEQSFLDQQDLAGVQTRLESLQAKEADLMSEAKEGKEELKQLSKARSKTMLQTLLKVQQQLPEAFIYLVAGTSHLTDLCSDDFLPTHQIPFISVTFEQDPDRPKATAAYARAYYGL